MRIVTWNVASLPPTARNVVLAHGSLAKFFAKELAADIICLQEVKLSNDKLTKDLVIVDGYESFWATSDERKGYSGVTTWCASPGWRAMDAESDGLGCREGRVCVTDHGPFAVINVYVPNAGDRPGRERLAYKLDFLARLRERMDALAAQGKQVIAVGDFNVAPQQADLYPGAGPLEEAYCADELAAMRGMISEYPDAWRRLHPDAADKFTVWDMKTNARPFNRGCRIDFVLLSKGLMARLRACEIRYDLPPTWSDHAPVICDLDLEPAPPPAPCRAWLQLQRRFVDPNQRSIKAMFAPKKAGGGSSGGGDGGGERGEPEGQEERQGQGPECKRAQQQEQQQGHEQQQERQQQPRHAPEQCERGSEAGGERAPEQPAPKRRRTGGAAAAQSAATPSGGGGAQSHQGGSDQQAPQQPQAAAQASGAQQERPPTGQRNGAAGGGGNRGGDRAAKGGARGSGRAGEVKAGTSGGGGGGGGGGGKAASKSGSAGKAAGASSGGGGGGKQATLTAFFAKQQPGSRSADEPASEPG